VISICVDGALHDGLDAFDATVLEIWSNEFAPSSKSAVTDSKITKLTFSFVQGRPAKGGGRPARSAVRHDDVFDRFMEVPLGPPNGAMIKLPRSVERSTNLQYPTPVTLRISQAYDGFAQAVHGLSELIAKQRRTEYPQTQHCFAFDFSIQSAHLVCRWLIAAGGSQEYAPQTCGRLLLRCGIQRVNCFSNLKGDTQCLY
jgi:hypothetical protein